MAKDEASCFTQPLTVPPTDLGLLWDSPRGQRSKPLSGSQNHGLGPGGLTVCPHLVS